MKKILVLLITLLLFGCSNSGLTSSEKDVYKIYEDASEKLNDYDSYQIENDIALIMTRNGETGDLNFPTLIQVENNETTDFYFSFGNSIDDSKLNLFYKDGTVYTSILGNKVKANLPKIMMNVKNFNNISKQSKGGMITGSKESTSTGTRVNLEFSTDSVEKIIEKINFENNEKIENIESSTVKVVMNVDKNGALIDQKISFDAVCTLIVNNESNNISIRYEANEVVSGVNSTTISYPTNLDEYKSLSIDKVKEFLSENGLLKL